MQPVGIGGCGGPRALGGGDDALDVRETVTRLGGLKDDVECGAITAGDADIEAQRIAARFAPLTPYEQREGEAAYFALRDAIGRLETQSTNTRQVSPQLRECLSTLARAMTDSSPGAARQACEGLLDGSNGCRAEFLQMIGHSSDSDVRAALREVCGADRGKSEALYEALQDKSAQAMCLEAGADIQHEVFALEQQAERGDPELCGKISNLLAGPNRQNFAIALKACGVDEALVDRATTQRGSTSDVEQIARGLKDSIHRVSERIVSERRQSAQLGPVLQAHFPLSVARVGERLGLAEDVGRLHTTHAESFLGRALRETATAADRRPWLGALDAAAGIGERPFPEIAGPIRATVALDEWFFAKRLVEQDAVSLLMGGLPPSELQPDIDRLKDAQMKLSLTGLELARPLLPQRMQEQSRWIRRVGPVVTQPSDAPHERDRTQAEQR